MITFDRWTVSELELDVTQLSRLWLKLQNYPTLFSDTTRSDIRNWISMVRDPSYLWYLVWEGEEEVGLLYVHVQEDDADLHIAFFDRKPAEKKELVKMFCRLLFDGIPALERISAQIPEIYYATWRLAHSCGFKHEGTKRSAVQIGGKRVGIHLYSLLRTEAYGLPQESRESVRDNSRVHAGGSSASEARR